MADLAELMSSLPPRSDDLPIRAKRQLFILVWALPRAHGRARDDLEYRCRMVDAYHLLHDFAAQQSKTQLVGNRIVLFSQPTEESIRFNPYVREEEGA
jgi:hypothetical protein